MKRFSLATFPLEQKTVLLRVDYNVPLEKGRIADNRKIKASLPTIKYLRQKNCKIIIATHLGRPKGKVVSSLKTDLLAKELKKLLPKQKITKLNDCIGKEVKKKIENGKLKEIFLLENLRFYKEEEKNDSFFAHSLANLTEVYVNDAFGVCHRQHASLHAITKYLPSVAGILVEKEILYLNKALRPKKPAVWVIGGAKLDKIGLLNLVLKKTDYVLIGGALGFAFWKARGIPVGMSKSDAASVRAAKSILRRKKIARKIILPLDFVVADKFTPRAKTEIVRYNQIRNGQIALDLGPETIKLFKQYLRKAHTIVWNGPLGYFEWAKFATATKEIGRFIGQLTATSICGGGETAAAIYKFHLEHNLTHVSTGGGAALAYLSGKKLPGIEALGKNYQKFRKKVIVKDISML